MLELRQYHNARKVTSEEPAVGTVVIIKEDGTKRSNWRLGRIEEVLRGTDGHVRGAQAVCTGPTGRRMVMQRPIQKLVPVEIPDMRK